MITIDTRGIQREFEEATKKLQKLPWYLRAEVRKKIMEKAAKPMVKAARNNVPVSKGIHIRYNNGKKVAKYHPGNLKRAIRILRGGKFRRTSAVFVGPKLASVKKQSSGESIEEFKGRKVDAFYAHFLEFGTPHIAPRGFMRKAFQSEQNNTIKIIRRLVKKRLQEYAREQSTN